MKYISICSGIEAATTAWHSLGWEPLAFSEIEPFPCAVLAHHWPRVPNLGDMTKYENWTTDIRPDLIVGGTPCQAFSVAGLRKGLADPRGNLTLTFLAILARYRPQWVVWENVPGVLSENTGAFGAFLGGLGELGYGFAYRVLDAQYFGVAQRRKRVFVVGYLGDWRPAAAVLFERESLSGHPAPSRETGKGTTTGFETGPSGGKLTEISPTLDTRCKDGPIRNQLGIGVIEPIAARMVAFGEYACDETASTMKQRDYKDATDLVVTSQYGEIAGSLTARHDSSPCADRGQNVVCIAENIIGRQDHNGGNGKGFQDELAYTLNTVSAPAVTQNLCVRRLTPRECERLQGFPDDHTLISFRDKPAADGSRYKACGNSMAVPVMRWIGERIEKISELLKEISLDK
jgi:DNA (cytosine-5)-methyltransferase 1